MQCYWFWLRFRFSAIKISRLIILSLFEIQSKSDLILRESLWEFTRNFVPCYSVFERHPVHDTTIDRRRKILTKKIRMSPDQLCVLFKDNCSNNLGCQINAFVNALRNSSRLKINTTKNFNAGGITATPKRQLLVQKHVTYRSLGLVHLFFAHLTLLFNAENPVL